MLTCWLEERIFDDGTVNNWPVLVFINVWFGALDRVTDFPCWPGTWIVIGFPELPAETIEFDETTIIFTPVVFVPVNETIFTLDEVETEIKN